MEEEKKANIKLPGFLRRYDEHGFRNKRYDRFIKRIEIGSLILLALILIAVYWFLLR